MDWTTVYRMVPIELLPLFKALVESKGQAHRVRYRGPHRPNSDTLKRDARAFTMYVGVV